MQLLLGNKEWSTNTCYNVDETWKCYAKKSSQKTTFYMILFYEISRIGKSVETESRLVFVCLGVWGEECGKWWVTANGYRVSCWGDENILK